MVFSALILIFSKWLRNTSLCLYSNILLLLIINLLIYTNIRNNTLVIEKSDYDMHYRRIALESLKNGMLDKVPENSTLIITDKYNYDPFPWYVTSLKNWANFYEWDNSNFIFLNTKKRYKVIRNASNVASFYENLVNKNISTLENTYEISIQSYPDDNHNKEGYIST